MQFIFWARVHINKSTTNQSYLIYFILLRVVQAPGADARRRRRRGRRHRRRRSGASKSEGTSRSAGGLGIAKVCVRKMTSRQNVPTAARGASAAACTRHCDRIHLFDAESYP